MRRFAILAAAVLVLAALPMRSTASPIVTGSYGNSGYTVSSTDLIEGQLPGAGSVLNTQDQEGLNSDTTGAALTNGAFGPAGLVASPGPNPEMTIINNGTVLNYSLPSPTSITEIDTYSGWRDGGRANQDYIVSVSTNGGSTYTPLATVNYDPYNGNYGLTSPADTKVAITDSTGVLATGVTNIQFSFPNTENGYVGYRELDVFGASPVPEPASLTLLGLGGLGLVLARRRRLA